MERILVTGSEGRIGQVLLPALANDFEVFGLDIRNADRSGSYTADITKLVELKRVFSALSPIDAVVHLAGNPNELSSWEEIYASNILGTRHVYDCANEFGVKRVIFASSTHLIGSYSGYPQGPQLRTTGY